MNCPNCNVEMELGEIGVDAFTSKGMPRLFWAQKSFFNTMFPGFLTVKKAVNAGGVEIKIGNGMINNRTSAHICKTCNLVTFKCN